MKTRSRWGLLPLLALSIMGTAHAVVYQLIPIEATGTVSSISNNGWVAGTAGANNAFVWPVDTGLRRIGDLPTGSTM